MAFDLFDAGVAMKRAQLAAAHPRASAARLDQMVKRWLVDRPLPDNGLVRRRLSGSPSRARPSASTR